MAQCSNRGCRQRWRLALLECSLGVVALAAVVAAGLVAPWLMARNAGLASVRSVAGPLVARVVASARSEVLRFLSAAPAASLETLDRLSASRTLPLGDLGAEMAQLLRTGLRLSPDMRLRYLALGYADGRMACAYFESSTGTLYLNDVDRLPDGNLTHQRLFVADPATLWNASYPLRYDDDGPYDVLPWVLSPQVPPEGHTRWFSNVVADVSSTDSDGQPDQYELLLGITAPVYSGGAHVATLNVDMALGAITEYLATLDLSPSARVLVLDARGTVIGNSEGEPVTRTDLDDSGVPQTVAATDLRDPMARAVARHVAANAEDARAPFYFASDTALELNVRLGGREQRVHVSALPTTDAYGLNWTTLVCVAESDYTHTLYESSRDALAAGIGILAGTPVVVGALFAAALRAMYSASRSLLRCEAAEMGTSMDRVVAALRRMRAGDMSRGELRAAVDHVMAAISAGLFHVDVGERPLDAEQRRWLRQEFVPAEQRDARAAVALAPEADVPGTLAAAGRSHLESWAFSVLSRGASCFEEVGAAALRHVGCARVLGVADEELLGFLRDVEGLYREENPYHNATHAADVTQAMVALLGGSALALSPLESVSLVLACVVHDVGHPGRNNHFQTAARTDLALLYNDASVLENHHAATAFHVMRAHGLLDRLDGASYAALRKNVIGLIMATDMGHHFPIISEFNSRR
eukprot:m51a1_g13223 hypothetical protein (699) ;mRNA; f:9-2592